MTAPTSPLVGRDRELELLERLLSEARDGTPRFAQVTGEPGIGKTYLLSELGRRADADGWLVLSGRCSELEREVPFGLVIDAFDAYLASLNPRDFDRIAPDELSELAGLFPSLRSLVPEPEHPSTPVERFRAHKAVEEMIERLAARQPLLLLLDDLHWADAASIEQAGYVLRHPPQAAVMLVGSFRSGQADPALVTAVEAASREHPIEFLELGPLSPEDAGRLVGGAPDSERLYEQSGGNPFYLLQLARADGAAASPASQRRVAGNGEVPAAVATTVGGELDAVSEGARDVARAAAVAGDPFDLDLTIETADVDEAEGLGAIDELIERDLIRPTPVPRTFQFRHPLVRRAVYESCSPGARLAAHQRAAQALAARGAPASERAHHVEHAARRGDIEAVAVLRQAGEEAAGRAPASAARWFEAALRLLPGSAPSSERLSLLMALAAAQAAIGRLEASRTALIESIELADDGGVPRTRVIAACAAVEQLLGLQAEAHRRLLGALEDLPGGPSVEAAALTIELAVDAFYRGEYDRMHELSMQALEAARPLDHLPTTAAAAALAAFASTCTGPVSEAEAHRVEAADVVDDLSDEELAERLDATAWLTAAEFYLDRYDEGTKHARRGLAVARATGQGELLPALTQGLGNLLFRSGHVAEAAELLDGAIDAARLTDNAVGLAWSLLNRSFSALYAGDIETALETGEEAVSLTEGMGGSGVAAWAGAAFAAALLEAGKAEQAVDILVDRGGGEAGSLIPGAWRANWLESLTRGWLALGRPADAETSAARSRARAEEFALPLATGAANAAEASVALAAGDPVTAAQKALAAAASADEVGATPDAAQWRILAGRALAAAGDEEAAAEALEPAAAEFDAMGASRYRDKAERELGKLGRRTHRRTRAGRADATGVGSLTGRELEVARLVVDRRTNPEIAAELFLSIKTVETHMRNIFRKLDVASRVEVARVVERHPPPA